MLDVVLRVKAQSSWVIDVGSQHDVPIVIFNCVPNGNGGGRGLFEIRSDSDTLVEVEESLRSHPDLESLHIVTASHESMYGSVIARNWTACSTILKSDSFLKQGTFHKEGSVDWELLVSSEEALSRLMKNLAAAGCKVSLVRKRAITGSRVLTKRQESVVIEALASGYYDFPRRISGAKLARKLGISQSTLSETLQRAERRLVDFYMRNRL
jgi:predicted DNA binding protein